MKVCIDTGCANLTSSTRCDEHTRRRDRARGTRQERGYGATHDAERARLQSYMDAGVTYSCWRCGDQVDPKAWHLGHCDDDRSKYHGPEHPTCNLGHTRGGCTHRSHM